MSKIQPRAEAPPRLFQAIDDKSECIGIYTDGRLFFDDFPDNLSRTWRYSASLRDENIEYAEIFCAGRRLEEVCPDYLKEELKSATRKMNAYIKSFKIAKVDMNEHCFFDLVPEDFLIRFFELKNKITESVFEDYEKPQNYDFLSQTQKLLHKIKYQRLSINNEDCKHLFYSSLGRKKAQQILSGNNSINYNLFGTRTGRLTTKPDSFPILTLKKEYRKMLKPKNDWFLSLDYNAAEIRTFLAIGGYKQPPEDVHQWNIKNIFKREMHREEAKTMFFSWFYNPDSKIINSEHYDRKALLKEWYSDGTIRTPLGREIEVEEKKAFNYLIQSTTSDLVLERAIAIDEFLKNKKSFISHIVHDEIVIDFSNGEREFVQDIKKIFAQNQLGDYIVNLRAGKNYLDMEDLKL
jgi:hypothetical protein